jgi:hypothetical protein
VEAPPSKDTVLVLMGLAGLGQERSMARQLLLNRGAQIEAQVKAIGHMLRLGRTVPSANRRINLAGPG